ncbi:MAG: hypothetical protein AAFO75_12570 [Pseudomonadota bacterium]
MRFSGALKRPSATIPRSTARPLHIVLGCLLALLLMSASSVSNADGPPSPEEYVDYVGGDASIVEPGRLILDGKRQLCGRRPTVLDSQLDDYGAAYPGFLIMNPRLLDKVSTPVKFWIYAHECGHQFRGPDEETADCFAVQRGRRQGWLSPEGLEKVCDFIRPARGDIMHLSGSHRCEYMRQCYADPRVR